MEAGSGPARRGTVSRFAACHHSMLHLHPLSGTSAHLTRRSVFAAGRPRRVTVIKNFLKRILRRMARLPVIGRPIRMAAALYRLAALAERGLPPPVELQKIAEAAAGSDQDNLALSVPVALRRLRRDLDRLEARLAERDGERA